MAYIVLKQIHRQSEGGKIVTYHPGDTIQVGRQLAMELIAKGAAEDPFKQVSAPALQKKGNGLVVLMKEERIAKSAFGGIIKKVPTSFYESWSGEIPYPYTAVWNGKSSVTKAFLGYGWSVIQEDWEVGARLAGLHRTLQDIGTPAAKGVTKELLGDLRVPVYATDLIFIRDTEKGKKFAAEFARRCEKFDNAHAFAQAWYLVKPMLNTLPKDWIKT